jgi:MFS transporter, Spinster family, sphingosine-1-phosphate transporter
MRLADFSRMQRRVILILMLVNFVNYVDRQIIFSLFPAIQRDFGLSFAQLGFLATVFTVVLAAASLPMGMLADRVSKRAVISGAVLFWGVATFFSGLAGSFRTLLVARGMLGVGEAAYNPAGTAVLSASFPGEVRARVQGAFDIGMFIGGAVGIALGGVMLQKFGWRSAFFLVGIPGVLLGLSALRLPKTVVTSSQDRLPLGELLRVPAFIALMLSGWFCSFAGYAYVTWGPQLVNVNKGFTAAEAGTTVALTIVLGGAFGIATGAYLSDKLSKVRIWGRAVVVPIGFVLAAPLIFFALHSTSKLQFVICFGLGAFFLSWYHGPLTATIHDLVPPRGHATALGFYNFFVNLCSMAVAPLIIGKMADRYGLINALHIPIVAQLIGAALFVVVIRCIRRDGLHHPDLARHWAADSAGTLPPPMTFGAEGAGD